MLKDCGYATNPNYAKKLIGIIELYKLHKYDNAKKYDKFMVEMAEVKDISPDTKLHPIHIYNKNYYLKARHGDTFRSISKEVGISYKKLAKYNERDKNDRLIPGEIIYLKKKQNKAEKNKNTPIYSLASANSGLGKIKTPQIKKIDNSKQNKIEITWDKISGVSGYVIYTSNTKKIKYTKCKTIKGSLSKTIINIGNGKSMYVKIRALKKKNGKYVYSGFSNAKKVTEIGGVWYQKVLKSKNGRYNVQRCFGQDLQKCIANRNEFTYYQVTDINKDGIKELILHSDINSPYDGNYILLLTYYNNKVKPLLYVGGSGKRGGYYISGKNFIVKMGGSDFYYLGYFTIKAGKLVVTRQLQYTMEKNRTEYKEICYYNKREITYTEYSNLRQKYNTNGLKEISFKQITV